MHRVGTISIVVIKSCAAMRYSYTVLYKSPHSPSDTPSTDPSWVTSRRQRMGSLRPGVTFLRYRLLTSSFRLSFSSHPSIDPSIHRSILIHPSCNRSGLTQKIRKVDYRF